MRDFHCSIEFDDLRRQKQFLSRHIRRILETCPTSGSGVHRWIFLVALALARAGVDPETASRLVRDGCADCGRYVEPREIIEAIRNAARIVGTCGEYAPASAPRPKAWPTPNFEQVEAVAVNGPGIAGLEALSPGRFPDNDRSTEEIVDHLFRDHEFVCAGRDKNEFQTRVRSNWRGRLASVPFIVPSPMTALTGRTLSGTVSPRALANTGPRRFLVIEFDFAESDKAGRDTLQAPMLRALLSKNISVLDLGASLHLHLAQYAPLVLVVFSGRRSLHGWFYCQDQPDEEVRKFMSLAVSLGADPATWTRNQMVRMPDGTRADGDGARQTVHYFRPEVLDVR